MTEKPIYLDFNATTPIDPAVFAALEPYLREHFGNPSSDHAYGYQARKAVNAAREQLAGLLGAEPDEVVFTGSASEASNLALKGVAYSRQDRGKHIITSAIEHPAGINPLRFLEQQGYRISILPVDADGRVDPQQVASALTDQTILVSIMHANNEVGTIQPIQEIAAIAHERDILVHTDAAQTVGKIPINIQELGVDLLSVAGHKFYAPKGVGALIVRREVRLEPLIHGASYEQGMRAGTENVPYLVALGCAAALAKGRLSEYHDRVRALRDTLHQLILNHCPMVLLNGHLLHRLPNTLNLSFRGINAAALLGVIRDRVACSTGSACHAGHAVPSSVLVAMGRDEGLASAALRLSLGLTTTMEEVRTASSVISDAVRDLRLETLFS